MIAIQFKKFVKNYELIILLAVLIASPFGYRSIHNYIQPQSAATPGAQITPLLNQTASSQVTAPTSSPSPAQSSQTKAETQSSSGGSASPASSAAPSCTKDTTYAKADGLSISYASPGLKQVIDPVHYYRVYGYTPDQIRAQLNQCSSAQDNGVTFDASTDWWMNYAYNVYTKPSGQCAINSVAVGLHITQAFPSWQPSAYDSAGLAQRWSTYTANLATHEQGHVNLDSQAANNFLSGLQSLPDTDCSNIYSAVGSYASSQFAALNQANVNYDAQTNHGATQGATFP